MEDKVEQLRKESISLLQQNETLKEKEKEHLKTIQKFKTEKEFLYKEKMNADEKLRKAVFEKEETKEKEVRMQKVIQAPQELDELKGKKETPTDEIVIDLTKDKSERRDESNESKETYAQALRNDKRDKDV